MGISEDIKQKQFQSEHHKALINLIYTHNYVLNEMNIFFKSIDITRQQYNVLRILRGQYPNPCSINLIKERMLDKMSDASRIVQRLNSKGLVERENSDHDRRAVEVTISKNGLDLLANTDEKVRDFSHLLENLDNNEAKLLNTLLDKIRAEV